MHTGIKKIWRPDVADIMDNDRIWRSENCVDTTNSFVQGLA